MVQRVRDCLPEFDLLVVNDGSSDLTAHILRELKATTATHCCNLGYGRAIQTALKFALSRDYDALITLDADAQHQPEAIPDMYDQAIEANGTSSSAPVT